MDTRARKIGALAALFAAMVAAAVAETAPSPVGLLHRSREEVGSSNLWEALRLAQEAVLRDPAYGEAWKQQGRVFMLLHLPFPAIASFDRAEILQPDDRDIATWKRYLLLDLGRHADLMAQLDALPDAEFRQMDPDFLVRLLADLLDRDAGATARRLAERWRHAAPGDTTRAAADALALVLDGDTDGAVRALQDLATAPPQAAALLAFTWDRLGLALQAQREWARAQAAHRRAASFRPDWLPPARHLGWAQRSAGQGAAALATWQHAVDTHPDAIGWLEWIADLHLERGEYRSAEKAAARLLDAQPASEPARAQRLAALLAAGDPAAGPWEQDLAGRPDGFRPIALGRALAARLQKDYARAAAHLSELGRRAKDDPVTRSALLQAYRAWAAAVGPREALIPLKSLLEWDPEQPAVQRDYGWSCWAIGEREEAIAAWDRAIRGGVANRDALVRQSIGVLVDAGLRDRAQSLLADWATPAEAQALGQRAFADGRLAAAVVAFDVAASRGSLDDRSRLLLAHSRALLGDCGETGPDEDPPADPEDLDVLFETLALCRSPAEAEARRARWVARGIQPPPVSPRVTDRLDAAADQRRALRDYGHALRLYRRVLARDADRVSWFRAAACAEALGRRDAALHLVDDVRARTRDEAVRLGTDGWRADVREDADAALAAYAASLRANPDQPDLRYALFQRLVQRGRLDDAREHMTWFLQRLDAGDRSVRTVLAEMWTAMGPSEEALQFWTDLHTQHPANTYCGIERARMLYRLNRPDEAVAVLEEVERAGNDARAFELRAEIEDALARPEQMLEVTARGLAVELTPGLMRWRADAAEKLGRFDVAYEAATAVLAADPGHAGMARLRARALLETGRAREARSFLESLTNRNPAFLHALLPLRDLAVRQRRYLDAVRHAETVVAQRPWDLDAIGHLASALGEDRRFEEAEARLQPWLDEVSAPAVAALFYDGVTDGPYPGRNTAAQIVEHIARLHREGYAFATPGQIRQDAWPTGNVVLLVLADADTASLERVDAALAEHGARATYAGAMAAAPGLGGGSPRERLQANGRWFLAGGAPLMQRRIAVDTQGTLGNPLTQRQLAADSRGRETDAAFGDRVAALLAEMSAPASGAPRVFVYPRGDYGQLSLDTDPGALALLRGCVARAFDLALAADDAGFITPESDPLRLPLKRVPPHWTADDVLAHIRQQNPRANLHLQYAKLLSWNRRFEAATTWFDRAEAGGADRRQLLLHRGADAYRQGDLDRSLRLLEAAAIAAPADPQVAEALARTRRALESRQSP